MEELATFRGIIEGVERKFADMAEFCIGAVRKCDEGWYWQKNGKDCMYVPQLFAGEAAVEDPTMDDVRVLQELTVDEYGARGKRYLFDNDGLLSVLGVRLDAAQLAGEDAAMIVNESQCLEVAVFGVPDVTEGDVDAFFAILDAALEE